MILVYKELDNVVDLAHRLQVITTEGKEMVFFFKEYEKYPADFFTKAKVKNIKKPPG